MMQRQSIAPKEFIRPVESSIYSLQQSLKKLDGNYVNEKNDYYSNGSLPPDKNMHSQWHSQLEFVQKLIFDIDKITNVLVA